MSIRCSASGCERSVMNQDKICQNCSRATRIRLAEIPVFYIEAGAYLEPGKGGSGSSGSERTIGVNLAALGFRQASDILGVLNGWVELVVEGRDLAPYLGRGTIQDRVEDTCSFLLRHALWLTAHDAAGDWHNEILDIHKQGQAATRKFIEKQTSIKCPSTLEDVDNYGEVVQTMCAQRLVLGKDILDIVECKRCGYEWTTLRLVTVAVATPGNTVWFDSYAIGSFLGITADYVTKLAKKYKAKTMGQRGDLTYDLVEIQEIRNRIKREEKSA